MMRTQRLLLIVMICLVFAASGCRKSSTVSEQDKSSQTKIEPRSGEDVPPTVIFDIKASHSSAASAPFELYDCTYQAQGKTAKFRFELKQKSTSSASLEGKFIAVAGSDNTILLEDLKKALDANEIPRKSPRIAELPFDAIFLADKMSRGPEGAFSDEPPGDWMMVKIFLPKGGRDEGEIVLFLNPALGKGEFSMKDPDYGNYLLKEFAKVL
jgi:hypothetical protein